MPSGIGDGVADLGEFGLDGLPADDLGHHALVVAGDHADEVVDRLDEREEERESPVDQGAERVGDQADDAGAEAYESVGGVGERGHHLARVLGASDREDLVVHQHGPGDDGAARATFHAFLSIAATGPTGA